MHKCTNFGFWCGLNSKVVRSLGMRWDVLEEDEEGE